MKHQITLLGGQITPVFWGIIEKNPDIIHVLYTKDSQDLIKTIQSNFKEKSVQPYLVAPYAFDEIKTKVEVILSNNPDGEFELNLTGGTKVMALASQEIFNNSKLNSFYIDQRNRIYNFIDGSIVPIQSKIKIDTFLKLSGHKKYTFKELSDYGEEEIKFAQRINRFSGTGIFKKAMRDIKSKNINVSSSKPYSFKSSTGLVKWDSPNLIIKHENLNFSINSSRAFEIAFKGLWWELVIADVISSSKIIYEQYLSLELYSNVSENSTKNEIDIVINTGRNLIFIECKSGTVTQADINKIRAVKKLYAGISGRSILVSKYKPREDILEKCSDLGIEVYYQRELDQLKSKLNELLTKMEL